MNQSRSPSPTKRKDQRLVFKLSNPAVMKFRSQRTEGPAPSLMDKVKTFSKLIPFRASRQTQSNSKISQPSPPQSLKFIFMLDSDCYLVGNHNHCDAFAISMLDQFIETDHLWTFKLKSPIEHMLCDARRRTIIVVSGGQIQVFGFQARKSKVPPQLQKIFKLTSDIKFIQFAKDMLLAVFFQNCVSFYSIDGIGSKQIAKKEFHVSPEYVLYQAPQCVQGILNVFFTGPKTPTPEGQEQKDVFGLYALPIQILNFQMGKIKQVYDIESQYKDQLKVETVNKECYLLNLAQKIMMFKRGYMVDTATVNYQFDNTYLRLYPDRRVVIITPNQIDMYHLHLDLLANPPKISLQSTDCIMVDSLTPSYRFLEVLRLDTHKYVFFYQIPSANLNGQIQYQFVVSLPWNYDQKINSILPKVSQFKGERTDENSKFMEFLEVIKQRCETVEKMGMTRRQAYLWIWKQSDQSQIQQFKLLLDTHDYPTIKNQIQLKLKKKMMQLGQVHKMQMGCLGMLEQDLFSPSNFNQETLKNYLISHLLARKLQLFKSIKLYQKEAGMMRATDIAAQKGKLMINIQEYTNTSQMDIRAYLLQSIYNYCKFKKDLVKEIRMIIRQFRVQLRYGYLELLKDIIDNAREELLFLLKTIPEILPFEPTPSYDGEDIKPKSGVWPSLKEEEWGKVLYLGQVQTVYNRQLLMDFSNSMFIRRNYLTYHDMIYLNRSQIQHKFKVDLQKMFYYFLQQLFDKKHGIQDSKIQEVVNFIQDFYTTFPPHLFNNIFLYRKLYLYFTQDNFIKYSFEQFLRLKDDYIFKEIFDHQKFKKGSLLKQVKPIYQGLGQGQKFNYGLLKFFSSNLSQVSDIKYLLNRINNQKIQFHAQNEQMYEVLIKGMQIKLKLGSAKDIPIEQVLIYLQNIPLKPGNSLSSELKILKEIQNVTKYLTAVKLDMSVFQIIRSRDIVLMKSVQYVPPKEQIRNPDRPLEQITQKSKKKIKEISDIRSNIYGPFDDNNILFMYLVTILQNVDMKFSLPKIIQENVSANVPFGQKQLQSVVYYCYRRITIQMPLYVQNQTHLLKLVQILPEQNVLRSFVQHQIALARIFTQAGLDMVYPICGESGIISKTQINGLFDCMTTKGLLALDLPQLQLHASQLQKIVHQQSLITTYQLYQKLIECLLRKGLLKQTLSQIQKLLEIDETNPNNNIYLTLVFRKLSVEFVDVNKELMLNLMSKLFKMPKQLLGIFKSLVFEPASNDQQKTMLMDKLNSLSTPADAVFNCQNPLFDTYVCQYLKGNSQKLQDFQKLLKHQLFHIIKSNQEFFKSIDFHIMHLFVVQNPSLLVNYLHKARYLTNVREIRCFLSFLSKYQIFDQLKVLEYSKRLFKVLYQAERDSCDIQPLISQTFEIPLNQFVQYGTLPQDTSNLNRLSKAVQKFKGKIKAKVSSSSLKKKKSTINVGQQKIKFIDSCLADNNLYASNSDYPFNDSDGYIQKLQMLEAPKYRQRVAKKGEFNFKKYLRWMLMRTDQHISHYLIIAHQIQADEELKRMENALKTSFSNSPLDKIVQDHRKTIFSAFVKTQGQGSPIDMVKISSIPVVQGSAISAGGMEDWLQQVQEVNLGSGLLKDQIVESMKIEEDGKVKFNCDLLRNFNKGHDLQNILADTLKQLYNDQKLQYNTMLLLTKEIYTFSPKQSGVNLDFLEIYMKIDQLQRKLSLELPMRQLCPFAGLLLVHKESLVLFQYLKQLIKPYLNENNVHTLSRIISLAFKKPQFQQQLNNSFLLLQVQEFIGLQPQSMDERLKLQKIMAFAQKMPLATLKSQMEKTIQSIAVKQKRDKLVKVVSDMLKIKSDVKGAQQLQSRWLNPE